MGRPSKEIKLDESNSDSVEFEKIEEVEPKLKKPKRKFHEFMDDPLAFENYIELNPEYVYYWHDRYMIERMGMGIWERVDSSNHKILKGISEHADGSIRVGTAILYFAWKEDAAERQKRINKKTDSLLPKVTAEGRDDLNRIAREGGLPQPTFSVIERRY